MPPTSSPPRHRCPAMMVVCATLAATVALAACGTSAPTTKAALCQKFDALGKEVFATHLLSDNAVFRRAGDLADAARHYQAAPTVKAEAPAIRKIADSDSTSGAELMDATEAIAEVCGHPLISLGFDAP